MNIISDSIFVNPPPSISIVDFDVCANDSAITLSSGYPMGGIYSGSGISNGIFDPSLINDSSSLYTYVFQIQIIVHQQILLSFELIHCQMCN